MDEVKVIRAAAVAVFALLATGHMLAWSGDGSGPQPEGNRISPEAAPAGTAAGGPPRRMDSGRKPAPNEIPAEPVERNWLEQDTRRQYDRRIRLVVDPAQNRVGAEVDVCVNMPDGNRRMPHCRV